MKRLHQLVAERASFVIGALYAGSLLWLAFGGASAIIGGVTLLTGAAAVWVARQDRDDPRLPCFAGVTLHLAILLTGTAASPLLPLVAVWIAWVGWTHIKRSSIAALIAAGLLFPPTWISAGTPLSAGSFELLLLLIIGVVVGATRERSLAAVRAPGRMASMHPPARLAADDIVLKDALELLARAAQAQSAVLWKVDLDRNVAVAGGHFGTDPAYAPPGGEVALSAHPFRWVSEEQLPLHLQRGQKALPEPWTAEMLVAPVPTAEGVVALGYRQNAPSGAQRAVGVGARHLSSVTALLAQQESERAHRRRLDATLLAVRRLPGELRLSTFARSLARAAQEVTGATATIVVAWDSVSGAGEILHSEGPVTRSLVPPVNIGVAPSRIGLALRNGVTLSDVDPLRSADALPIVVEGEEWEWEPRATLAVPLLEEGRSVGGVVACHSAPGAFSTAAQELLELVCSVAAAPLQSALRYEEIEGKAYTDPLTGLPNRSALERRLASLAARYRRERRPFGVVLMDIDHFKQFNDRWGHEAGDRVLQHVASLLRANVRDDDLPARLGGEEFVLVLGRASLDVATEAAERIRRAVEAKPLVWKGKALSVTASFGVAGFPTCCDEPGELLNSADAALYHAKSEGRNRVSRSMPQMQPVP